MRKNNCVLWPVVQEIIKPHYDEIKTERLRDGWYIVREYLNNDYLKTGKISQEDYEHFLKPASYSYYTQDLWPQLERTGFERPDAKPLGIIYSMGDELTISQFEQVSDRARGFIFVEKAGEAEDIKSLSNHGWAVVAGQGYSTRLMRTLFKDDKRPVLVLHDADTAGDWIYKIFDVGSTRTKHLELWLENVIDLGLNEDDSTKLELPPQQEAKQYRDKRKERWELSAFTLLKKRYNLENPVLAYTIAKMKQLGIRITPTPMQLSAMLKCALRVRIEVLLGGISNRLQKMIDAIPEYAVTIAYQDEIHYPDGSAVDVDLGTPSEKWDSYYSHESHSELFDDLQKVINDELERIKPWLITESQGMVDNSTSTSVDEYEEQVIAKTNAQWMLKRLKA